MRSMLLYISQWHEHSFYNLLLQNLSPYRHNTAQLEINLTFHMYSTLTQFRHVYFNKLFILSYTNFLYEKPFLRNAIKSDLSSNESETERCREKQVRKCKRSSAFTRIWPLPFLNGNEFPDCVTPHLKCLGGESLPSHFHMQSTYKSSCKLPIITVLFEQKVDCVKKF
jgi:hypothetical protein